MTREILVATTDGVIGFPDGTHAPEGMEVNALALAGGARYAIADAIDRAAPRGRRMEGSARRPGTAGKLSRRQAGLLVETSEAHLLKESRARVHQPRRVRIDRQTRRLVHPRGEGPMYAYPPKTTPARPTATSTWRDPALGRRRSYMDVDHRHPLLCPRGHNHSGSHPGRHGLGARLAHRRRHHVGVRRRSLHATGARMMPASRGPGGSASTPLPAPARHARSFERCGGELPEGFSDNINTGYLSARGTTVAFGAEDGELYVSNDSAATFARVAERFPGCPG